MKSATAGALRSRLIMRKSIMRPTIFDIVRVVI